MALSMHNSNNAKSEKFCYSFCKNWWRCLKWTPVLIILAIVAWSYYAYVILLCLFTIENDLQRILYLVLYHGLLVMFLWSYMKSILCSIRPIPDKYKLPEAEMEKLFSAETEEMQRSILENFSKDLPIVTRTMSGAIRYCNRCALVKPDRAHHCSMCSTCVTKMDHHCPWVNNCINFHNYKFFMLFLTYALSYCLFVMLTTMQYFVKFFKVEFGDTSPGRYHIIFVFFVALMFAISLASLWGYHCYLVFNNRTTIEAFHAPMFRSGLDKNGFSLGYRRNFIEVFGRTKKLWFIPVFTSLGDGVEFTVKPEHQFVRMNQQQQATAGYESMGITRPSSLNVEVPSDCMRLYSNRRNDIPENV